MSNRDGSSKHTRYMSVQEIIKLSMFGYHTSNLACVLLQIQFGLAPTKESDQPGHWPTLIRIFGLPSLGS